LAGFGACGADEIRTQHSTHAARVNSLNNLRSSRIGRYFVQAALNRDYTLVMG